MKIERTGDDICLGFLLERELFERGHEQTFEGEISGVIAHGAFVRFAGEMADVYEGFLPARRVPGDHYELNETQTALIGRRKGRRMGFGDPVTVTVESVAAARGRVDLLPAPESGQGRGKRGAASRQGAGDGAPKGAVKKRGGKAASKGKGKDKRGGGSKDPAKRGGKRPAKGQGSGSGSGSASGSGRRRRDGSSGR
jgi:ribonuclease R